MWRRIAKCLLAECLQLECFNIGICLLTARAIAKLNETYLHHLGPTDVITFNYSETPITWHYLKPCGDGQQTPVLCGEVFICVDEAIAQARRFRISWQSELVRYLVHGLLHLNGYDDSSAAERRRMKRKEDHLVREIAERFPLRRLGCKLKLG